MAITTDSSSDEASMPDRYPILAPDSLLSPSLVIFREHLLSNIDAMISMAGSVDRLRPHCKTHKMASIVRLLLERGIQKHKAATIAEAEMLAQCGVPDVMIHYGMVGPNQARVIQLAQLYPQTRFSVSADDVTMVNQLGRAAANRGVQIGAVLDINPGRDRTGVRLDDHAVALYQRIVDLPGLSAEGLSVYDGQRREADPAERRTAVFEFWDQVLAFRERLEKRGLPVPRVVCGGTPTFPVYSQINDPQLELSPGTCVFHDMSYGERFPDLAAFTPAAVVFTRVVSRPTARHVTLDVGTKSIASDPPMGERAFLPAIPQGVQVLHNEEHLVVETPEADRWKVGDWLVAIPRHVCPTSALHRTAIVVERGQQVDEWEVTARDRRLTV